MIEDLRVHLVGVVQDLAEGMKPVEQLAERLAGIANVGRALLPDRDSGRAWRRGGPAVSPRRCSPGCWARRGADAETGVDDGPPRGANPARGRRGVGGGGAT